MAAENWLDPYLLQKPGAVKDYKEAWGWTRYQVDGKLFAATCRPGPEHAAVYAGHPLLTLKADPLALSAFTAQYPDILPGFYMDKRHWLSIRLDGDVPEALIRRLCDDAYRLIAAKLTKKRQRELLASAQPDKQ